MPELALLETVVVRQIFFEAILSEVSKVRQSSMLQSPSPPTNLAGVLAALSDTCQERPKKSSSQVGSLDGKSCVGRRLSVFWKDDQAWYFGVVKEFHEESGVHTVVYDDGDVEQLDLACEPIKWAHSLPADGEAPMLQPTE